MYLQKKIKGIKDNNLININKKICHFIINQKSTYFSFIRDNFYKTKQINLFNYVIQLDFECLFTQLLF